MAESTLFAVELQMFGQTDAKLAEQEFLLRRRLDDATQSDLATVSGR
jgi:hypothetical protein